MSKTGRDLIEKREELYKKYNVSSQDSNWIQANNELKEWAKERGILDVQEGIKRETIDYPATLAAKLMEIKKHYEDFQGENFNKFEELFLKVLEKEGESIDHLKEIGKDDPMEVINIIGKVLAKNINYDLKASSERSYIGVTYENQKIKHSDKIPYITLGSGLGICYDYAQTFAAAKYALEKQGVTNLDKFVMVYTDSEKFIYVDEVGYIGHSWDNLLTVNNEGIVRITSVDLTKADDEDISKIPGKLNAVDEQHHYSGITEKVDKAHQEAVKKILEFNTLVEEEKLREILTTLADAPRPEIPDKPE